MSIRVSPAHFSGTSKVFGRDPDHLAAIVRGLAIDMIQVKIDAAEVGSFTGTAGAALVNLIVPSEPFDATSAAGSQLAAFDAAMGKVESALAVLAQKLNPVQAVADLDPIIYQGTVAVAVTIPGLDKTVTVAGMPILANIAGSFAGTPLASPAAEASTDGAEAVSNAGIWRPWSGERKGDEGEHRLFAFLTTQANAVVAPIHAKAMPVILTTPEDCETWLGEPAEAALALQRPAPDDLLRIVATGAKSDPIAA